MLIRLALTLVPVLPAAQTVHPPTASQEAQVEEAQVEPQVEEPPVVEPQVTEPVAEKSPLERSLDTLATIQRSREAKQAALATIREQLTGEITKDESEKLAAQEAALQSELEKLNHDYDSVATGIDVVNFDAADQPKKFDLQSELQALIKPIVEELKSATEAPRRIEELQSEVNFFEDRERQARRALDNIESLLAKLEPTGSEGLEATLKEARASWTARIQDITSQKTVAQFKLDKRRSERSSIIDSTRAALQNFFRTRGRNLLVALTTFLVILFGLRWLYERLAKRLGGQERPFYARLVGVLYWMFVGSAALTASLLVLYASDDWVLLGLALMFLLGIAWASKTAVPMFLEQIRLLLNFGAVRERERVLLDGIPYRVSKISFYTLLSNPELAGGIRRLPIRDLIDMRSRTASKDEVWFPCRRGDWVKLADGEWGFVLHQSPDTVRIEKLGGTCVTYPSEQFLGLAPQNLSAGFRLRVRFGIDYAHQAICTTQVPQIFEKRVLSALHTQFGEDCLSALKVEFWEAGASSLDYAIIADVAGSAAQHYDSIQRAIQRTCVDTCNSEGWIIPFTQITLHQAAGASAS